MPSLPLPHKQVVTQWGVGVLDFQYALTKKQKEEGKTPAESDVRLLLKPGSRATRRTALRISFLREETDPNGGIALSSSKTLALLENEEGLARFLHSHSNLPKRKRVGVLHEQYLKAFLHFHASPVSTHSQTSRILPPRNLRGTPCAPTTSPSVLRKAVSHKSGKGLRVFCAREGHAHAPLGTEKMVVDHILELQLLHSLNQKIRLPESYLKEVANESWNLQLLGSLQNRAKAWVVLKYLQRKESKSTTSRCGCVRCVATSLLPRENLRCAGSLRSLAHEQDFECLVSNFKEAWESFLNKLEAAGFERERQLFKASYENMLTCLL